MNKNAFDKGLVRLEVDKFPTECYAKEIAELLAGGLPSLQDLIDSDVNLKKFNFWTFVLRNDDSFDVVQLGHDSDERPRFTSITDKHGRDC